MTRETRPPDGSGADQTPTDPAREARLARLSAYLDGDLSPEEAEALEAEINDNPELERELEELTETLDTLHSLQVQAAPDQFVYNVEGQIRTRSRGRFFDDDIFYRTRIPYEAFAALMFALMAALYFFALPDDPEIGDDIAAMGGAPTEEETPERGAQPPPGDDAQPRGDADAAPEAPEDGAQPQAPQGDDQRNDQGDTPDAPQGDRAAPEAPQGDAPRGAAIRRETIIYTLGLTDPDPRARAEALGRQLRATSSRYRVEATSPTQLQISLPAAEVDSFLGSFGKGATLRRMRLYTEAAVDPGQATVHIHVSSPGARGPKQSTPRFP